MSEYGKILAAVKRAVSSKKYKEAQTELEKLLVLLKLDYEAGKDREKSGKAYNKLLQVRNELINKKITSVTYDILKIAVKPKEPEVKVPDENISTISSFFDDVESEDDNEELPAKENDSLKKLDNEPVGEPKKEEKTPEKAALEKGNQATVDNEFKFEWDEIPVTTFEDIAGLDDVKELIRIKVLLPLLHPEAFEGYVTSGGGGLCLYGPPGTGKTMMAAAIANKINAKFCSVTPSDLIHQGAGNTEKSVRALFQQARSFKCAVIYFDEMDSIAPKSTKSQYARQLRSEFLAQLQGISSYGEKSDNILFLICATNKPWDIDSAFLRPGRFGTKVYVGLPDYEARKYIINHRLNKIRKNGIVKVYDDIDIHNAVEATNGYNCADISHLMDYVEEISVRRAFETGEKYISNDDLKTALKKVPSTVQADDLIKLNDWRSVNDNIVEDLKDEDDSTDKPANGPKPVKYPDEEPKPESDSKPTEPEDESKAFEDGSNGDSPSDDTTSNPDDKKDE